jgi:hypothetical protein
MSAFADELAGELDSLGERLQQQLTAYRRGLGSDDEAARGKLFATIESLAAEEVG